jgi:hypothetical protein
MTDKLTEDRDRLVVQVWALQNALRLLIEVVNPEYGVVAAPRMADVMKAKEVLDGKFGRLTNDDCPVI